MDEFLIGLAGTGTAAVMGLPFIAGRRNPEWFPAIFLACSVILSMIVVALLAFHAGFRVAEHQAATPLERPIDLKWWHIGVIGGGWVAYLLALNIFARVVIAPMLTDKGEA